MTLNKYLISFLMCTGFACQNGSTTKNLQKSDQTAHITEAVKEAKDIKKIEDIKAEKPQQEYSRNVMGLLNLPNTKIKRSSLDYQQILVLAAENKEQAIQKLYEILSKAPAYFSSSLFFNNFLEKLESSFEKQELVEFIPAWFKSLKTFKIPSKAPQREALAQIALLASQYLSPVQANTGPATPYFWEKILYADLPETQAAKKWFAAQKNNSFAKHLNSELWMKRARSLEKMHDNKAVFELLKQKISKTKKLNKQACEVTYLLGKSARKVRRYKEAQNYLKKVVEHCAEPWKQKALYTQTRVATYGKAANSLTLIATFLKRYPKSRYSDDVTLWKAEYLLSQKKEKQALQVYQQLIQKFPDGDMTPTAHFAIAFSQIKAGENKKALKTLKVISKKEMWILRRDQKNNKDSQWKHIIAADQSLYWQARLLIYPKLTSWNKNPKNSEVKVGLEQLKSLINTRFASFYGDLAIKLVQQLQQQLSTTEKSRNPILEETYQILKHIPKVTKLEITDSDFPFEKTAIEQNPDFDQAIELIMGGHNSEAHIILEQLYSKKMSDQDLALLAFAYSKSGGLAQSHQLYRFAGKSLFWNPPITTLENYKWNLAYPRAYEEALSKAAAENKFPAELLLGLSREESAFQAGVISWAGAIGLCQLMPRTAREEANLLHIKYKADHQITEPFVNARLGAHHLARRLKSLKHPFLGIAAYNAGPGNVNKWRKKHPYLPVDAFVESIPVAQTRNYVKKVTGSWVIYTLLAGKSAPEFSLILPKK